MIARRAVRGALMVLASSYANMALGIVYGIAMARLLDPDQAAREHVAQFTWQTYRSQLVGTYYRIQNK
jgi:hypothetical protein